MILLKKIVVFGFRLFPPCKEILFETDFCFSASLRTKPAGQKSQPAGTSSVPSQSPSWWPWKLHSDQFLLVWSQVGAWLLARENGIPRSREISVPAFGEDSPHHPFPGYEWKSRDIWHFFVHLLTSSYRQHIAVIWWANVTKKYALVLWKPFPDLCFCQPLPPWLLHSLP